VNFIVHKNWNKRISFKI